MAQLKVGDFLINPREPKKIYKLQEIDGNQILLEDSRPGQNIRYIWRDADDYKKIKI